MGRLVRRARVGPYESGVLAFLGNGEFDLAEAAVLVHFYNSVIIYHFEHVVNRGIDGILDAGELAVGEISDENPAWIFWRIGEEITPMQNSLCS